MYEHGCVIRLALRIEDRGKHVAKAGDPMDFGFDLLDAGEPVEALLLAQIGVGLLDTLVALNQVLPEEQFEVVGAELPLER